MNSKKLSTFLSTDEQKRKLFHDVGKNCQIRATAFVQIYGDEVNLRTEWTIRCQGIAVFVKDQDRHSFYIQVYDVVSCSLLFEQEIYKNFAYVITTDFFHQFETEDAIVGINFSNNEEAFQFGKAVTKYINNRIQKAGWVPYEDHNQATPPSNNSHEGSKTKIKGIRKNDISEPMNFVHVQHVGFKNVESEAESGDTLLTCILEIANIKPSEMRDPNVKKMIQNYIEDHGGKWKVYRKLKKIRRKEQKGLKPTSNEPSTPVQTPDDTGIARDEIEDIKKPSTSISANASRSHSTSIPRTQVGTTSPVSAEILNYCSVSSLSINNGQGRYTPRSDRLSPVSRENNKSLDQPFPSSLAQKPSGSIVPSPPRPPPQPSLQSTPFPSSIRPQATGVQASRQEFAQSLQPSRNDLLKEIQNPGFRLKPVNLKNNSSKQAKGTLTSLRANDILSHLAQVLDNRRKDCRGDSDNYQSNTSSSEEGSDNEW